MATKSVHPDSPISSAKRTADGTPSPRSRQPNKKHNYQPNPTPGTNKGGRPKGKTGKSASRVSLDQWASSLDASNASPAQSYVPQGTPSPPSTARLGITDCHYTTPEVSCSSQLAGDFPHSLTWMNPTAASIARRVHEQHVHPRSPRTRRTVQWAELPKSPIASPTGSQHMAYSPTPAQRGAPSSCLRNAPSLPPLQQNLPNTQQWLRRSAVDGVYSSPAHPAPPLDTPLETIPDLTTNASLTQRIKYANECLKKAGFTHPSKFIIALMTFEFRAGKTGHSSQYCDRLQYHQWYFDFEEILNSIDDYVVARRQAPSWTTKLESYNRSVVRAASSVLHLEFLRYGTRKDPRRRDQTTKKRDKAKRESSHLQLDSSEVSPEFLASNVVSDMISQFQENTPHLWQLLSKLTHTDSYRYRDCGINPQRNAHIQALILSMIYNSWNRGLRRMQTWIGCYLHTSGVKEHVIDLLAQYGISVGHKSICEILKTLADRQKGKLKQIGTGMVNNPVNMVYDNINIHEKVGQQRGDHQDGQFNGICGFVMPMPGGPTLIRRDTIQPQLLDGITSRVFLENKNLAPYSEILQRRQIEITIQQVLLGPVLELKSKTGDKPYLNESIRWRFDPRDNATNCPDPSRELSYEHGVKQTKYSLKTIEAEELSHEGTITWLTHILRDQLGIPEDLLKEFIQIVIGDLGTVIAIHSAKRLRSEDTIDLDKLRWAFGLFGLFHLRKAFLELIVKSFYQPGSSDFAHLDRIIRHKNFRGFANGKCQHFRKAEDLILLTYRSYIVAWIMKKFPHPRSDATPTDQRNHASRELYKLGKDRARDEVVTPIYENLFSHRARENRNPKSKANGEGPKLSQQDQAGQMLTAIGIYIELRETEKYGRVGKLPNLFELLLPWFAGTSASLYTRELVKMILLKKCTTPDTYNTMLDSLFIRAKIKWFVAADVACEQEVRINKEVYTARGGSFRFEHLLRHTALVAGSLYDCKVAVVNGHIPPEKAKHRGKHFDPSMERDIISLADMINHNKILDLENKSMQTIQRPNPYRVGWKRLQTSYDLRKVVSYMFDLDFAGDGDAVLGETIEHGMDSIGADPNDPDIVRDDDDDEEDFADALMNARLQLHEDQDQGHDVFN